MKRHETMEALSPNASGTASAQASYRRQLQRTGRTLAHPQTIFALAAVGGESLLIPLKGPAHWTPS